MLHSNLWNTRHAIVNDICEMSRKTNSTYQPQQLLNFRKNIYLDQESTTPGTRATSGMRDDFSWHTKWFDAHPKSPEDSYCWCSQWRLRHSDSSSSAQFVDYALSCRTWACLLCIFVPPPTSLIKFVNSGSLHWVLWLFIYFHCSYIFVPCFTFRVYFAGDLNQKISFVVGVLSKTFARALLGLIRPSPSCPIQLNIISNIFHIRLDVFMMQWICILDNPASTG